MAENDLKNIVIENAYFAKKTTLLLHVSNK